VPVHQAGDEKSSLATGLPLAVEVELVLLALVEFELFELFAVPFRLDLLETWLELLELFLLVFDPMLARMPTMTAATMPSTTSKPIPPKTQGSALDFLGAA
jgi:hypothetical protein